MSKHIHAELMAQYAQDDETDNRLLKRGLVHLTEEAATTHAKALLSFTTKAGGE